MSPVFKQYPYVSLFVLSALMLSGCSSSPAAADSTPMPPPEVEVATAAQEKVDVFSEWVATIDGSVNAQIQPQVAGYVVKQNYSEGAFVQKGQVLFEIDAQPFQAVLDQSKGQLAQAEGQVAQAEARSRRRRVRCIRPKARKRRRSRSCVKRSLM